MVSDLKFFLKSKKALANPQELSAGHESATQLKYYNKILANMQGGFINLIEKYRISYEFNNIRKQF